MRKRPAGIRSDQESSDDSTDESHATNTRKYTASANATAAKLRTRTTAKFSKAEE